MDDGSNVPSVISPRRTRGAPIAGGRAVIRPSTASPPQQTQSWTRARTHTHTPTPPVITSTGPAFLDGGRSGSQSVGQELANLLSSAIGWEPSAVESGYASASASVPAPVPATTSHESVLSPPRVSGGTSNSSVDSTPILVRIVQIQRRWHNLAQTLTPRYPNPGTTSGKDIAKRCMALFFEYLYPLTPLVHKASLHKALALLEGDGDGGAFPRPASPRTQWPSPANMDPNLDPNLDPDLQNINDMSAMPSIQMQPEEAFTLLTAVCAEAAFLLPSAVFPEGSAVADAFLDASRICLNSYLETDLETPNANSIIIRYFHSNCLHGTGRPKYSWHIFGEATRLIQAMCLHDVSLLAWLPPLEAELRRRAFWIVYMGDKSAAILNGRPMTIHRFSFDSNITLPYPTNMDDDLILQDNNIERPPTPGTVTTPTSTTCIVRFNANLELWQVASHLLLEIRVQKEKEAKQPPSTSMSTSTSTSPAAAELRRYFHTLYVGFITELDRLPLYLQPFGRTPATSNAFMSQCVNLHVSFYCLRVVILQNLRQLACFDAEAELEPTDLRTTEVVRDMLRLLHDAPFWALQVNGEPLVEKLRLLGGSLLAIIHRHEDENENEDAPLVRRARSDFSLLLDILSRLDSRASDSLKTRYAVIV